MQSLIHLCGLALGGIE
uniref:Uncharacterized protein n=1 Tax=Rhizophora mucronata TaxID=61149 RepID=A0A2P2NCC5_RHIMU